jgi:hypothetical protein
MRKSYLLFLVSFVLVSILTGCTPGGGPITTTDFSGDWTMTNTTTSTSAPSLFSIGSTSTTKCNIVDNNGSLTIYNFKLVGNEFYNWNVGYGTRSGNHLNANVTGSYLNVYGDTVSVTIYFEGDIDSDGISGTGTWTHTFSIYGNTDSASGTTIFVKG